jgi:hypothetical protein
VTKFENRLLSVLRNKKAREQKEKQARVHVILPESRLFVTLTLSLPE